MNRGLCLAAVCVCLFVCLCLCVCVCVCVCVCIGVGTENGWSQMWVARANDVLILGVVGRGWVGGRSSVHMYGRPQPKERDRQRGGGGGGQW